MYSPFPGESQITPEYRREVLAIVNLHYGNNANNHDGAAVLADNLRRRYPEGTPERAYLEARIDDVKRTYAREPVAGLPVPRRHLGSKPITTVVSSLL